MLAICALGLALRLYRLGDWTTGIHNDEAIFGAEALRILDGNWTSPFLAGYLGHSNFTFWSSP